MSEEIGTKRTFRKVSEESAKWAKADMSRSVFSTRVAIYAYFRMKVSEVNGRSDFER
jgi:hypothetical protein